MINLSNELYNLLRTNPNLYGKIKVLPKTNENFFTIEFTTPTGYFYKIHKGIYCGYGMSIKILRNEIMETSFMGKLYEDLDIINSTILIDLNCDFNKHFMYYKNSEDLVLKIISIWKYLSSSYIKVEDTSYFLNIL